MYDRITLIVEREVEDKFRIGREFLIVFPEVFRNTSFFGLGLFVVPEVRYLRVS